MLARIPDSVRTGAAARCSVLVLSLALVVTGFPLAETPAGPTSHIVWQGPRLFVLTASTPLLSEGVPGDEDWSTRFVIHRGTPLEPQTDPTSGTEAGADLEHVATTSGDPFPLAASLVQGTILWDGPATFDLSSADGFLSATFRVGADAVSVRVPVAADQRAAAEVVINGRHGRVRLEDGAVETFGDVETALTFPEDLDLALVDAPGFIGFVADFGALAAVVVGQSLEAANAEFNVLAGNCTSTCLGCAGSLIVNLATLIAIVATCGGALVTGGATALGCFAAFLGYQGSSILVLAACGACSTCS